jgi:lipoate---protein ligase
MAGNEIWRLLDTGLRSAGQNIALNRALLESRRAGEAPSTLRFLRCTPAVLLGCQQSADQEVRAAYCSDQQIELQRRVTAGPAFYVDPGQLGWELYLGRSDIGVASLRHAGKRACHAVAAAVSALGIDARFRARAEIEVDGRRIGEVASASEHDAILLQGQLLIDCDAARLAACLRLPVDGSQEHAAAQAALRVAGVQQILGRRIDVSVLKHNIREAFESEFDVEFSEADLTLSEHARFQDALREIDTRDWVQLVARPASEAPIVTACRQNASGLLCATLSVDVPGRAVKQSWFSGELPTQARRNLLDLEAALRDVPVARLPHRVDWFFKSHQARIDPLIPEDLLVLMQSAVQQPLLASDA